jgi:hypothetical protein
MSKEKKCSCKGDNEDCPICEGTGIVLYHEDDEILISLAGEKESELEDDE